MSLKIDRVQLEIIVKKDQARQKMIELETQMRSARDELDKIKKTFGKNSNKYKEQEQVIRDLKIQYDKLFKGIGVGKLSLKELGSRQKELNAILRNMDPSIPEWKQYNDQLKEVNRRIKELKKESQDTSFSLSKLSEGFNKYAAMGTAAVASLTGIALSARKCVDDFAKMEEAESQVRKYTGMTTEQVKDLNESLKDMDTRTSREQLNALAGDAGKLGITGKKEILEFVDAADKINVSLGEDLGEDAVKNIGKLAQMFGEDRKLGLRGAMLATGSAINEVAQNSSAAEPYLASFTARVSGAANQAHIAQADIIGYASVLDQNMQTQELAATAFQNLMMKMYQDPAKFAKMAGKDVEEFASLIKNDANSAILEFIQTLGQKGGLSELAPMFQQMGLDGVRASGVISVLASKIDDIRAAQTLANKAYNDGTSVINEYNVQNNTIQAQIEKNKKSFHEVTVELGEKLVPAMQYMITTGSLTVKGLKITVSTFLEYKGIIITVTSAIAAYLVIAKARVAWDRIHMGIIKAKTLAQLALNAAEKASPWGMTAAGVTAAIGLYLTYKNRTDDATKSQKGFNKELSETEQHLNRIAGIDERANNLENLNGRQKEELKQDAENEVKIIEDKLTKETIAFKKYYKEQTEAINKRNGIDQAQRNALLRSLDNEADTKSQELAKLVEQKNRLTNLINKLPSSEVDTTGGNNSEHSDPDKEYNNRLKALTTYQSQEENELKRSLLYQQITQEEYQKGMYEIEMKYLGARREAMISFGKDTTDLDSEWLDKMIAESNRVAKEREKFTKERHIKDLPTPEEEEDQPDINSPITDYAIEKFKKTEEFKVEFLKSQRENDLISEEEYQDKLAEIEKEKSEKRAAIRAAAMNTISDLAGGLSDVFSAMQDAEISKIERKYDKEIKAAKKAGKDTTKLEEKKEEETNAIKKKYADKQFAAAVLQVTSSTAVAAMEAYKAMSGIPVVGPALGAAAAAAVIASGAAQITQAKQQRDEAKGLKSGGYSDDYIQGYTSSGNPDDVAGVIPVHKNEFVANHESVANPHVRQFLDIFDGAQRKGTIRMLNTTQILEQIRTRSGKYEGGYVNNSSLQGKSPDAGDDSVIQLLNIIVSILRAGNENTAAIRDRSFTVSVKEIRDGIRKQEKLESNISR